MTELTEALKRYWGYDSFLPLQEEAMRCVMGHGDSVVVLPTGGGKSLCYQVPAVCLPGMAIVVSPLISLMKDQVDGLRECGIPAAALNSSLQPHEKRTIAAAIRSGEIKLLYIAPERLVMESTIDFLQSAQVSMIAIDEAHCISEWGHDFRPEFRGLRVIRDRFPNVGVHAYTATATERVRVDIAEQLGLRNPKTLVGSFDRKNLVYRVQQRSGLLDQIRGVIERHAGESGIVYCTTRADTESICASLNDFGIAALPYHAGMPDVDRHRNQESFIEDRTPIIVATVAFGMGIDKPNVRFVVHAGMPKSLENYQQESGRAGRDGLEAECVLIFSPGDIARWKNMIAEADPAVMDAQRASLNAVYEFCTLPNCRHRSLVRYFGQDLPSESCNACDVCLGDVNLVDDAMIIGQKILSSVVRQNQRYGGDYTAQVLAGSDDKRILQNGHDKLSTYGLLRHETHRTIREWIEQLVGQQFLAKEGEYNVLQITPQGRLLLQGKVTPRLTRPPERKSTSRKRSVAEDSWEGVDRLLFEKLRQLRKNLAHSRHVPPYLIFGDVTLREMAKRFPQSLAALRKIRGVGDKKAADFGDAFVQCIAEYAGTLQPALHGNRSTPASTTRSPRIDAGTRDAGTRAAESRTAGAESRTIGDDRSSRLRLETDHTELSAGTMLAIPFFRAGQSVAETAVAIGRAESTVHKYLCEYLVHEVVMDWNPWVSNELAERIQAAALNSPDRKLKPIFEALDGTATYEEIRITLICLQNRGSFE